MNESQKRPFEISARFDFKIFQPFEKQIFGPLLLLAVVAAVAVSAVVVVVAAVVAAAVAVVVVAAVAVVAAVTDGHILNAHCVRSAKSHRHQRMRKFFSDLIVKMTHSYCQ